MMTALNAIRIAIKAATVIALHDTNQHSQQNTTAHVMKGHIRNNGMRILRPMARRIGLQFGALFRFLRSSLWFLQ